MLSWAKQFNIFCFLDNCYYHTPPHQYECLLAAGAASFVSGSGNNGLQQLDEFINAAAGWCFGHLSYNLKNTTYIPSTKHGDNIGFPNFYFFQPEVLLIVKNNVLIIHAVHPQQIYDEVQQQKISSSCSASDISVQSRISQQQYIAIIEQLKQHIQLGDCYEINFCQEFFANDACIDATALFQKLTDISPNPFAALYRLNDKYLICASPERFMAKTGRRMISQPIKGTIRRDRSNEILDHQLKQQLHSSAKDRAENIMVVDLVRNDLSKICTQGSVRVDELYGIYTFPQVHQMISTISGILKAPINFSNILTALFPMGSMTGAPKQKVMELIDKYECVQRGIFSGSVGYITPGKDFDFNVVIRSIMYNSANKYLSYKVGSGITFYSDPAKEWEECLLKAEAIKKVLAAETILSI